MPDVPIAIPHSLPWMPGGEAEALQRVLERRHPGPGPEVEAFESELAAALDGTGAVAVQSGTAALHLALVALGVGHGREVVVPSYACTALLNAVFYTGAYPRPADVDPETGNLTPETVRAALTPAVRAIILPHTFGAPAPVREILAVGLPVVEDCAMALGARYDGGPAGSLGTLSVFSFYATKVMATGQGGALASRESRLVDEARDLIRHDNRDDYRVRYNYALSDLSAALGRAQLARLPEAVRRRRELAARYHRAFEGLPGVRIPSDAKGSHLFYRYVLRTERPPEEVLAGLAGEGVDARRPVYRPLHRYLRLDPERFPGTEALDQSAVSVPLYPALTDVQAERVTSAVAACFRRSR